MYSAKDFHRRLKEKSHNKKELIRLFEEAFNAYQTKKIGLKTFSQISHSLWGETLTRITDEDLYFALLDASEMYFYNTHNPNGFEERLANVKQYLT